jgi:hypothetical protein
MRYTIKNIDGTVISKDVQWPPQIPQPTIGLLIRLQRQDTLKLVEGRVKHFMVNLAEPDGSPYLILEDLIFIK